MQMRCAAPGKDLSQCAGSHVNSRNSLLLPHYFRPVSRHHVEFYAQLAKFLGVAWFPCMHSACNLCDGVMSRRSPTFVICQKGARGDRAPTAVLQQIYPHAKTVVAQFMQNMTMNTYES